MKRTQARYKYAGKYAGWNSIQESWELFFFIRFQSCTSRERGSRAERFSCSPIRYINILNRKSRRYTTRS